MAGRGRPPKHVNPWILRLEQSVNKSLFSIFEKEYFVSFVAEGLLREIFLQELHGYSIGIQNEIYARTDSRQKRETIEKAYTDATPKETPSWWRMMVY